MRRVLFLTIYRPADTNERRLDLHLTFAASWALDIIHNPYIYKHSLSL